MGLSAMAMLWATSCNDDLNVEYQAGEAAPVAFSISAPEINTRAYSDGTTATVLQYAVYNDDGELLKDLTVTDGEIHGSTTVELMLTTGNTYSVVFWAAAVDAPYSLDFAAKKMTVDYTKALSNDENRDAFYKWHTFTVSGAQTETIELRRPFAQLNVGTNDFAASKSAGYTPAKSGVKVRNVYKTLSLADGKVADPVEVMMDYAALPKGETFPVAGYDYLSMNYLLVPEAKGVIDIEFGYTDSDAAAAKTRIVGSVPVQRNYRTNVYGQLLTSKVGFNVIINPEFEDPDNQVVLGGAVAVSSEAELEAALKSDAERIDIVMTKDLALNASDAYLKLGGENTKVITIDGLGNELNLTTTYWSRLNTVNPDAKIVLCNMDLTSSQASGTWNSYDVTFQCNVELLNVNLLKALALDGDCKTAVLKDVTITESHDYYALWIAANGQTVNIDGLTINSAGRGIKIDDQYVGDATAMVTLNINNAKFTTAKKAAIMVKTTKGATINASNLDITKVAADQVNAVWVDEDGAAYADKVIVNGASKKIEGK